MRKINNYTLAAILFVSALTVFKLKFITTIQLSNDEAYYYTWSINPSPGYYDSGPALGWIIRAFTEIFGINEFGVRFGSVLFSVLFNLLFWRFLRLFLDEKNSFFAVLLTNTIPAFLLGSVLMMHDSVMVFFWLSGVYSLYRVFIDGKKSFVWLAGLALGFGLWGKDTALFIGICLALYLAVNRFFPGKTVNNSGLAPWKIILIVSFTALAVFMPVIVWNIRNNFPTYRHIFALGTRADRGSIVSFRSFFDFLGSQAGLISPFVFFAFMYYAFRTVKSFFSPLPSVSRIGRDPASWREAEAGRGGRYFLLFFSLPVILAFTLLSLTSKVEGNWSGFGYIALIPLPFIYYASSPKRTLRILYIIGVSFSVFMNSVILYPQILYYLAPRLPVFRDEALKALEADRTNEVHGWRQLTESVKRLPDKKTKEFIFTRRYQIASEIEFYSKNTVPVFCFPLGRRYNQYDLRAGYEASTGRTGYYVTDVPVSDNERNDLLRHFDSLTYIKDVPVYRPFLRKSPIRTYYVYRAVNFKGNVKNLAEMLKEGGNF